MRGREEGIPIDPYSHLSIPLVWFKWQCKDAQLGPGLVSLHSSHILQDLRVASLTQNFIATAQEITIATATQTSEEQRFLGI